jgi:tetratricopeptide (TPR) repeat protein
VFTHDKIREVLHEELNPIRQRRLHQRIGESLERLYAAQLEGHVEDLAYHFARSGDLKKGLDYSKRAAAQAARLHALEEAIDFYGRARECAEELELTAELAEIEERLGDVWWAFGESAPAVQHFERSVALSADSSRKLSVRSKIGEVLGRIGDPKGLPILESVRDQLDVEKQPADMARVIAMIGRYHHYRGQHRKAVEYLQQARELAERIAHDDLSGLVFSYLAGAYQHLTEYTESNGWAQRLLELGKISKNTHTSAIGHEFLAENASIQGRWDVAIQHAEQDRQWGEKAQSQERVAWAAFAGSVALLGKGNLAEARSLGEAGLARAERIGEKRVAGLIRLVLSRVRDDLGEPGGEALAETTLRDALALELVHHQAESHLSLATIAAHHQEWSKVWDHAQAARAILEGKDARANPLRFAWVRAEALVRLERWDEARAAIDDAMERARFADAPHYIGCASIVDGLWAAQREPERALPSFDEGIAVFEQIGSRLDLSRALYERGLFRQRRGDASGAQADFGRAAEIARACGAPHDVARAESALRERATR